MQEVMLIMFARMQPVPTPNVLCLAAKIELAVFAEELQRISG